MIISLPVSALTKRIIESDYAPGVIRLRSSDLLFQQLTYTRPPSRKEVKKLRKLLTERIELEINQKLFNSIKDNVVAVGDHLYKYHCLLMMKHVEALMDYTSVSDALNTFMTKHQISEDDYPIDHAYRKWNRWKKKKKVKNESFFCAKGEPGASRKCNRKYAVHRVLIPRGTEYLDIVVSAVAYRAAWVFGIKSQHFIKHLRVYLYYMYAGMNQEEVCEVLAMPRRSFYYAVKRAKETMELSEELHQFVIKFVA